MPDLSKNNQSAANQQSLSTHEQQQAFSFPYAVPQALTHPGNVLLLTSVPLLAGAFVGYKLPTMQSLEDMVGKDGARKNAVKSPSVPAAPELEINADEARALASRTAVRAFRIATFGTVATFGVFGAAAFHLSGYQTMEEAVYGTRRWATSIRESLEGLFGTKNRRASLEQQHPDLIATKHMTEEQEINFLYQKYMASPPLEEEAGESDGMENKTMDSNSKPGN